MTTEKDRLERYSNIYEEDIAFGAEERINLLSAAFTLDRIQGPVIELGCGNGTWTKLLVERFGSVTVVDASAALLEKIQKEHGERVQCREALFEEFEPPNDDYSTVLLIGALHHSEAPLRILRHVAGWLHPRAKLVVSVPNAGSLHRRLGQAMGILQETNDLSELGVRQGHRRTYTLDLFRRHLSEAGLSIDYSTGLFLKPFSNAQMDSLSPEIFSGLFRLSQEMSAEYAAILHAECTKPR